MAQYKAVIFDLDGTLVNSIDDLAESINEVLRTANFPVHTIEKCKSFIGSGMRKLVYRALPESARSDEEVSNYTNKLIEIYGERCTLKTYPYDHIVAVLDKLAFESIVIAVLSNKIDHLTKKIVNYFFSDYEIKEVYGVKDDRLKKPNPEVTLQIAKNLNLAPMEILFVGDSDIDIQVARNAGMDVASVTWGFQPKEKLVGSKPDYIIDSPLELIAVIS
ncbi:phosphoglycolate phosphatase [Neptunitalea chrysea]|uniref:phosphoglycolate phosphatase n=1 Tax=Neptunitalea chrysea TaxID=1647581 RepID=A0A9W6B663_9FLAO|nr:HAD family hydrolase [Neptunitalea chrysea]GLB52004.1 phosphoglycolate phosphatase [Neptunitalea chrysea]